MATACPGECLLKNFVAGELSEADARLVAAHLEVCTSCSTRIDALEPISHAVHDEVRGDTLWNIQRAAANARNVRTNSDTSHFQPGKIIGEYRLIRILGRGGMGIVFEAEHLTQHRRVAFKVLSLHRTTDPTFVERFKNEIRIAQAIDSDCFVRCIDAGMHDDQPYLVMELLQGFSLEELVRNWGTLPLAESCEIGRQLSAALKVLKEQGFVHRDLKPANVMIAWRHSRTLPADDPADSTEWKGSPSVVVLDFGVARSLNGIGLQTTGQMILGTLEHMAPEQIRGTSVGPEADAYSLGTTLFKLLAGRAPLELIEGSSDAKARNLMTYQAVSIRGLRPDLPRRIIRAVDGLLSLAPQKRPSPEDVIKSLSDFAKGAELRWLVDKVPAVPREHPHFAPRRGAVWQLAASPHSLMIWGAVLLVAFVSWYGFSQVLVHGRRDGSTAKPFVDKSSRYLLATDAGLAGKLAGHDSHVSSLAIDSAERRALSTGEYTREVILWNLESGKAEHVFHHHLSGNARAVTFLSDDIGASGATDGQISIFDLRTGNVMAQLQDRHGSVMSLASVPGRPEWLMSAGGGDGVDDQNNAIHIWDWRNATLVRTFSGHQKRVYPAVVSPDGKLIASASSDRTVRIWRIEDEAALLSLDVSYPNEVLAWFPDSKRIVTCAPDFNTVVYDVETGKEVQRIPVNDRNLARICISPNGLQLLTTHGHDPIVHLWDVPSGKKVFSFKGNSEETYSCALLKDGRFALVAGGNANSRNKDDFALQLWRLPARMPSH